MYYNLQLCSAYTELCCDHWLVEVCALFKAILHLVLSLSLSKILSHHRDVTLSCEDRIHTWAAHVVRTCWIFVLCTRGYSSADKRKCRIKILSIISRAGLCVIFSASTLHLGKVPAWLTPLQYSDDRGGWTQVLQFQAECSLREIYTTKMSCHVLCKYFVCPALGMS